MRKPSGRQRRSRGSALPVFRAVILAGLSGCTSHAAGTPAVVEETGQSQAALSGSGAAFTTIAGAPASVLFQLDLDGERLELALQRTAPPTTPDYRSFRRTRDGALIAVPPAELDCTYRGNAVAQDGTGAAGFAAMSVCTSATGHAAGDAASGILRAGGRFWRLTPDPADQDASDGIDHYAQPLHRSDSGASAPEPALETTLYRLPESPAPRLEFREGTDEETKYIDLVVVNDAERVDALGGDAQPSTLQFVDTMNALLDTSGLTPRLRVTLRAQVSFDEDPYRPTFTAGEVDNRSLLNEFLSWGANEDLPAHDEHLLLSGLDFVGGVVGYAGLDVACTTNANGFIVQAGDASGGFAVLSAVHELGHTVGMNHDDELGRPECVSAPFIMRSVGCGNCAGSEDATFSPCSIEAFQAYLAGPSYVGTHCADDVPAGTSPSCGDGAVEAGESCDCGSSDCSDIDPCCNGATCQLASGAECSDFNDGCCQNCAVVAASAAFVCRPERSGCDIAEVCKGSKDCPADSFEAAGSACDDERGNAGACYLGDCRSRGTQCEQLGEQEDSPSFDGLAEAPQRCGSPCDQPVCGNGSSDCLVVGNANVIDGVPCDTGQCVNGQCVAAVDQCPNDPNKLDPGECGCGRADDDSDNDGAADCIDGCPDDRQKQTPGTCGCGAPETDTDRDGTPDCVDECPRDALKDQPGACGCGAPETDTDRDGTPDCVDECPDDRTSRRAGACGCGVPSFDSDLDGTPDCIDGCSSDPDHVAPPCTLSGGIDTDGDGDVDIETSTSFHISKDDGCNLTPLGVTSTPPGIGLWAPLGWLGLGLIWRRRARG